MGKFCPNCGKELDNNVKFCANCGTSINGNESEKKPVVTESNNTVVVTQQKDSNGMAIAGFVLSLVSFILCCGSFNWLSLIFSIVGLVQSKNKNGNGKGLAIAGIIISGIVLVLSIILFVTGIFASVVEEASRSM